LRISGRKARPWPGRSGGLMVPVFDGSTGSIHRSSVQSRDWRELALGI
jgi:hypothetical protein